MINLRISAAVLALTAAGFAGSAFAQQAPVSDPSAQTTTPSSSTSSSTDSSSTATSDPSASSSTSTPSQADSATSSGTPTSATASDSTTDAAPSAEAKSEKKAKKHHKPAGAETTEPGAASSAPPQ